MHQDGPHAALGDDAAVVTTDTGRTPGPDRRQVMMFGAAAGLGVAGVAALAGCGSDSATSDVAASSGNTPAVASAAGETGDGPAGALAKLSDVPVGGSYATEGPDGRPVVISQPQAGKVVAFSLTCTHAGCKVVPQDKVLSCPCHSSTFDPYTGKNLSGPAPSPLPAVAVTVRGTDIIAG